MNTLSPITLIACLLGALSVSTASGESKNATAPSVSNPSSEVRPTNPPVPDDLFRVGREVTVSGNTPLFPNRDSLKNARAEYDEEKRNKLALELSKTSWLITSPIRAKIIETDREAELCKIETERDGATVQYWVPQENLERIRTAQSEPKNPVASVPSSAPYGTTERKSTTESGQVQTPSNRLIVEMRLTAKEENGKLIVEGKTNLPDATNLMISVEGNIAGEPYLAQSKVAVEKGEFSKSGFSNHGNPLLAGQYKVEVSLSPIRQPQTVKNIIGKGLENLGGPLVKEGEFSWGGKELKQETKITIGGSDAISPRLSSAAAECAYNLAVIDAGGRVSKNSKEVARLTELVANVSRLTKESPETIGDCTVVTQEHLEKQGVKVSSYRLLTETYNTLRGVPAGTVTFKDTLALVGTILAGESK